MSVSLLLGPVHILRIYDPDLRKILPSGGMMIKVNRNQSNNTGVNIWVYKGFCSQIDGTQYISSYSCVCFFHVDNTSDHVKSKFYFYFSSWRETFSPVVYV